MESDRMLRFGFKPLMKSISYIKQSNLFLYFFIGNAQMHTTDDIPLLSALVCSLPFERHIVTTGERSIVVLILTATFPFSFDMITIKSFV